MGKSLQTPEHNEKFFKVENGPSEVPLWNPNRGSLVRSARVVGNCTHAFYKAYCFICWDYGEQRKEDHFLGQYSEADGIINTGDGYAGLHYIESSEGCSFGISTTQFFF